MDVVVGCHKVHCRTKNFYGGIRQETVHNMNKNMLSFVCYVGCASLKDIVKEMVVRESFYRSKL